MRISCLLDVCRFFGPCSVFHVKIRDKWYFEFGDLPFMSGINVKMAKKSSSKKSFKSLFSKSEAKLTVEKEKDDRGGKKFQLFKFKKNTKHGKDEEKQVDFR